MAAEAVDPELWALLAGLKPAIRVTTAPERADEVAARFRARGLAVIPAAAPVPLGGRPTVILYVARAAAEAALVRDAEAPVLPGHASGAAAADLAAHREVGRRLGFPRCCVEAFGARLSHGVDRLPDGPAGLAEDYVAARAAWVPRPDPRLNNLLFAARLKLISFYPCRYDCAVALRFAAAVHDLVQRRQPAAADALLAALSAPVVIAPTNARARVTLAADGTIARAEPPRDPAGRVVAAADELLAAALPGGAVAPDGAVAGPGAPPAWLVPFSPLR